MNNTLFGSLEPAAAPHSGGPFAAVALENALDKELNYAIPSRFINNLRVGQRIRVPLGRKNRPVYGYVIAIKDSTDYPKIKEIIEIVDPRVLIEPSLMQLSRWMSRYYIAPLGTVLESVIPGAVKKKVGAVKLRLVSLSQPREEAQKTFETIRGSKRRAILARLLLVPDGESIELFKLVSQAGARPVTVRQLAKMGLVTITERIDYGGLTDQDNVEILLDDRSPSSSDPSESLQNIAEPDPAATPSTAPNEPNEPSAPNEPNLADDAPVPNEPNSPNELDVPNEPNLRTAVPVPTSSFILHPSSFLPLPSAGAPNEPNSQATASVPTQSPIAQLPSAGAAGASDVTSVIPQLNEDQARVLDELRPRIQQGGLSVNLLLGVTGSGKTEVYLRCLREVVDRGKQAIVLVPEIALTPQTVRRFTQRFKRVAVLHSALSASDRHRYWQQVATGQADVVVGARSAIFAPVPNLGLIVVDEEHESSYKQESAPRYQARDVAIKRAQIHSVPVILGSATPSLEMYARAKHLTGDSATPYFLLKLPRRVRGLQMPAVELIDLKQERRLQPGIHLIGQRLGHLLQTTLDHGQQAILLLNRRGYSNFVYCVSCQEALTCKYCDTTLTYHRMAGAQTTSARSAEGVHTGQLHCHYCLAVSPLPDKCPHCGKKLSLFGLGTQRVEQELVRKFPGIRYARVDSDTMRSASDYETLLDKFAKGQIQVLLGTQMIAKGLDYPNVTLVGVISGDTALSLPDFRASERTFQLITQVAGRAGRGDLPGRVVLQTFMPDDPTIRAALKQDYEGFATSELMHRRETGLPPFGRMVRIIIRHQEIQKLQQTSEELATLVSAAVHRENTRGPASTQVRMKGPMPCVVGRIAGYYRYQLVLSSPAGGRLQRVLASLRNKGELSRVERVAVDVDPVSLL